MVIGKKGDVKTAFFIISSVIILTFILIFGFKAISDTKKSMIGAKESDFYLQLKNEIIRIRSSYAEVRKYDFSTEKISKACFYDETFFAGKDESYIRSKVADDIVYDSVSTGSANIFFFKGNELENSDRVEGITIEDGYLCIQNKGGKLSLTLEGMKNNKIGIYHK
jgi:hypothetical protein